MPMVCTQKSVIAVNLLAKVRLCPLFRKVFRLFFQCFNCFRWSKKSEIVVKVFFLFFAFSPSLFLKSLSQALEVVLIPRQSHVLHMWGVRPSYVGRMPFNCGTCVLQLKDETFPWVCDDFVDSVSTERCAHLQTQMANTSSKGKSRATCQKKNKSCRSESSDHD